MPRIHHCRVLDCPYIAAIQIGHTRQLAHMCLMHANVFRCLDVPQQREMLAACGPRRITHAGTRYVSTAPWPS